MKMKRICMCALFFGLMMNISVYAEEITMETESVELSEPIDDNIKETEKYTYEDTQSEPVKDFVQRLYEKVLDRNADETGLQTWVDLLMSKQMTGAEVARGFIDSKEFVGRNLDNKNYVTILYRTFFNREPDMNGMQTWMDLLENGMSRSFVFKGFAESAEFEALCADYGIIRGNVVLTEARDQNIGITQFVYRCYNVFLGRMPDQQGLNMWCDILLSREMNAKEVAQGFVFSVEFVDMGLDNENYVKTMYLGFFDRAADSSGMQTWTEILENGNSRKNVFYGFADSKEFRKLAESFGLDGGWKATAVSYKDPKKDFVNTILDYENQWKITTEESTVTTGTYKTGYSLIDLDFDGQLELVVTKAGGEHYNKPTEIWKILDDGMELLCQTEMCNGEIQDISLRYDTENDKYVYVDHRFYQEYEGLYWDTWVEMYVNSEAVYEVEALKKYIERHEQFGVIQNFYYYGEQGSMSWYDSKQYNYNQRFIDAELTYGFVSHEEWNDLTEGEKRIKIEEIKEVFSYKEY